MIFTIDYFQGIYLFIMTFYAITYTILTDSFQMDKYTVDLDKVLNDFEYSELTDQYVRPQQNHNNNNNRVNRDVSKHSINNVFHSLNEYLNTDVGDAIVADNNCVVDEVKSQEEKKEEEEEEEEVKTEEEEQENVIVVEAQTINNAEEINEVKEESVVIVLEEVKAEEKDFIKEEVEDVKQESAIVGFDQPVDLEEAKLNEYLEELEDDDAVEKDAMEENNCPPRPDSLPLDSNEQKKDIDLIGRC